MARQTHNRFAWRLVLGFAATLTSGVPLLTTLGCGGQPASHASANEPSPDSDGNTSGAVSSTEEVRQPELKDGLGQASATANSDDEQGSTSSGTQQEANPTSTTGAKETVPGLSNSKSKLHLILLVDEEDQEFGADLRAAKVADSIQSTFMSLVPNDQFVPIRWEASKARTEKEFDDNLDQSLEKVSKEDAVVFFYVGKGAYDTRIGTYLTPSAYQGTTAPISATAALLKIKSKKPKFGAVILECCNKIAGAEWASSKGNPVLQAPFQPLERESDLAKSLFFTNEGYLLLVSASPGEFALVAPLDAREGPSEPLFTNALMTALAKNMQKSPKWSDLIDETQAKLDESFKQALGGRQVLVVKDGRRAEQKRQKIELRFYK